MRCIGRCGGQSRYSEQCTPSGRYAPNHARPTQLSWVPPTLLREGSAESENSTNGRSSRTVSLRSESENRCGVNRAVCPGGVPPVRSRSRPRQAELLVMLINRLHLVGPEVELLVAGCTWRQKPEFGRKGVEATSGIVLVEVEDDRRNHETGPRKRLVDYQAEKMTHRGSLVGSTEVEGLNPSPASESRIELGIGGRADELRS